MFLSWIVAVQTMARRFSRNLINLRFRSSSFLLTFVVVTADILREISMILLIPIIIIILTCQGIHCNIKRLMNTYDYHLHWYEWHLQWYQYDDWQEDQQGIAQNLHDGAEGNN